MFDSSGLISLMGEANDVRIMLPLIAMHCDFRGEMKISQKLLSLYLFLLVRLLLNEILHMGQVFRLGLALQVSQTM